MATLPLTIQFSSLPPNVSYTPQQLADAIAARLSIVTQGTFALFVSGSTEPTSNVGPWLKNGTEWWVWSNGDGAYVPQSLSPESLGYTIGSNPPDPTVYNFWIETTALGSPLSIKIYYSGSWVDVYATLLASTLSSYYTAAQTNAAISAAVGGVTFANYIAQVSRAAAQNIPVDAAAHLIVWTAAIINPAPTPFNLGTSRYVAPAAGIYAVSFTSQVDNNTGVAASMQAQIALFKNGVTTAFGAVDETPSPSGGRWFPQLPTQFITLAVNDYLELWAMFQDGTNTGNVNLQQTYWSIIRVSA